MLSKSDLISNTFPIIIIENNIRYEISTDYNKYCYIKSEIDTTEFNTKILFLEKSIDNIYKLFMSLYSKENNNIFVDNFHIFNKIEEFTKFNIDYNLLETNLKNIKIEKNNLLKNIPNNFLLSQNQLVKLLLNDIKKVNRNSDYKHYIIPIENTFNFLIKFIYEKIEITIKLIIEGSIYPFYPPKLEWISPQINIKLLLAVSNLDLLTIEKWTQTVSLEYLIINLGLELEKYIYDNLDTNKYSELDNELIKFSILTKEIKSEDIKINITIPKSFIKNSSYWVSGIGYGTSSDNNWDINNYIKGIEILNENIIKSLNNISNLINKENIYIIYDSVIINYIKKQINGLTLLEIQNNKELYYTIFNILILFVKIEYNQQIINVISKNINSFYNELCIFIDTIDKDIKLLHIYTICNYYMSKYIEEIKEINITVDEKELYCNIMKKLQFGTTEIQSNHSFWTQYNTKISQTTLIRLLSEISSFKHSLPLNWETTIWIRVPKNNFHLMTFIISGPKDTPYENGLFEFHTFFPDTFPNIPPKVLIKTTGNGKIRFNPNLYACGKVCLSLLGTWSGNESEQWNSSLSSFIQVLISIQSLILVEKPYFNEPGYERDYNTTLGKTKSDNYNEALYSPTMRYAMIEMIKNPPMGYEDVIKNHFKMKKNEIINKTLIWEQNSNTNKLLISKTRKELLELLEKI